VSRAPPTTLWRGSKDKIPNLIPLQLLKIGSMGAYDIRDSYLPKTKCFCEEPPYTVKPSIMHDR